MAERQCRRVVMEFALYFGAFLTVVVGVAHSYLGERHLLIRLFRREDLPKLFGSTEYTIRTLRVAWHLTTVAWWGFAVTLVLLARLPLSPRAVGAVIGCTFLIHFFVALVMSRGRHLSLLVFLAIGVITIYATHA